MPDRYETWPYEHRTLKDGSGEVLITDYTYSGSLPFVFKKTVTISVDLIAPFKWDGASIPRIMWRIVGSPLRGKYQRGGLVHDWLYKKRIFYVDGHYSICSRALADRIFLRIMRIDGVSWWKRHIMYLGVRLGGWRSWNKRLVIEI